MRIAPVLLLVTLIAPLGFEGRAASISYNRDIRPILSDNCFHCHGPDKKTRDSGLRLDIREDATKPAKSGDIAIVPGDADESQLLVRIFSDDKDEIMPPPKAHKKLTAQQKDLLKRWIEEGAKYEAHWAYTPLVRPEVPSVSGSPGMVQNPVDAFIQKRLEEAKVQPAPAADKATLIRRLSLDLAGLPPTPDEVAGFEKDGEPGAYERLVDRLLASPRYGERMAQQWLDLARYADTVGFHGDQNQNVWAYRDWVINAYNKNMRFDQFTIEQLAGDLLPNPTVEQKIATCFNRLNMVTREGGAQPKEYLSKYTADRIRTVGTAWLGSTLGCAECHDHKFDPWSQKDFYSIGAFFADVKQWGVYMDYNYTPNPDLRGFSNDHPFPPEIVVESDALKRRIADYRRSIAELVAASSPEPEKFAKWQKEIAGFIKNNPSGWETPKPRITLSPSKTETVVEKDGSVTVEPKTPREITIDLPTKATALAALKIELLPSEKAGKKILRGPAAETLKPAFAIVKKDGASTPITMRHAQADLHAKSYANGYDLLGVHRSWKLNAADLSKKHTAVYFPARPLALQAGDVVRVSFPESTLAAIRASVSPLSPTDLQNPSFPENLGSILADSAKAGEWYLRSTAWAAEPFDKIAAIDREILECRDGKTPVLVTEKTDKPLTIRLLGRGNWQDETGEICPPATPHFLPALADAQGRDLNRLDLAKWIVSDENPLTARVVINRLWRQFFGNGLSAQTDDLGAQGESPSHPELLDWLAVEFRENGWDTKRVVKLLVMSHTYQQVAGLRPEMQERDPQNRLLASQNPRRLDAEFVRDNALAISGLLNLEMGGPAAKPYQPDDYYADIQFPSRKYQADLDARQWRRGVYTWWQRTFLHPMLLNFDAPSREDCIAMRTVANTPQQALTLLNDPTFLESARVWATRLLALPGDDRTRIRAAFQQAVAREPKPQELESLVSAVQKARTEYQAKAEDAPKLLSIGLAPKAESDPIELAAWTTVCRVILNLHETITRY